MSKPRRATRWPWGFWETVFGLWMASILVTAAIMFILGPR